MSHKRVKAVGYDDDDLDEYDYNDAEEGGEEMSSEDKEHMRTATIEVRDALGSDSTATESEIQESLWYYYFDVGKTVTYIKSMSERPYKSHLEQHLLFLLR